jgi:hypothetical protein
MRFNKSLTVLIAALPLCVIGAQAKTSLSDADLAFRAAIQSISPAAMQTFHWFEAEIGEQLSEPALRKLALTDQFKWRYQSNIDAFCALNKNALNCPDSAAHPLGVMVSIGFDRLQDRAINSPTKPNIEAAQIAKLRLFEYAEAHVKANTIELKK